MLFRSFNPDGSIRFPDTTVQTTAYTGVAEPGFTLQAGNFNAVAGGRYGVNTVSGSWTATLPTSPAAGDAIFFADAGWFYSTNAFVVDPGTNTIVGVSGSMTVTTNGQSFGLFWNGSTWCTYNVG